MAVVVEEMPLESVVRLTRDMAQAGRTLSDSEIMWLVDAYYWAQDGRKRSGNQINASLHLDDESDDADEEPAAEPHEVIRWFYDNMRTLENQTKRALDQYTDGKIVGRWAKSIPGIGPVLSAGLMAHIDIKRCPTVGHVWRFAGLDPTVEWLGKERAAALVKEVMRTRRPVRPEDMLEIARRTNRRQENIERLAMFKTGKLTMTSLTAALARRPWANDLKVLCWKTGQCFIKVCNRPQDIYGKVYLARKAYENAKNERHEYADQAAEKLKRFNIRNTEIRAWYKKGMLPPGHINARSARYATKLFLSHLHHVMYEVHFGTPPPKPYILNQPGHVHFIAPPNWPMQEG